MAENLIAEGIGLIAGIIITYLVIDNVLKRRELNNWKRVKNYELAILTDHIQALYHILASSEVKYNPGVLKFGDIESHIYVRSSDYNPTDTYQRMLQSIRVPWNLCKYTGKKYDESHSEIINHIVIIRNDLYRVTANSSTIIPIVFSYSIHSLCREINGFISYKKVLDTFPDKYAVLLALKKYMVWNAAMDLLTKLEEEADDWIPHKEWWKQFNAQLSNETETVEK